MIYGSKLIEIMRFRFSPKTAVANVLCVALSLVRLWARISVGNTVCDLRMSWELWFHVIWFKFDRNNDI